MSSSHALDYSAEPFPWVDKVLREGNAYDIKKAIECLNHKKTEIQLCLSALNCSLAELEKSEYEGGKDEAEMATKRAGVFTLRPATSSSSSSAVNAIQYQ